MRCTFHLRSFLFCSLYLVGCMFLYKLALRCLLVLLVKLNLERHLILSFVPTTSIALVNYANIIRFSSVILTKFYQKFGVHNSITY